MHKTQQFKANELEIFSQLVQDSTHLICILTNDLFYQHNVDHKKYQE